MRSVIIHNPLSGFGSDAIFEFERALVHAGDECTFRALAPDFVAEDVVRDVDDFDVCVLSGGDGSVTGLLHALRGRSVPVCVFPSGTANLLFANIGNAPEPAALARACRVGHTACVDLGEISWNDEQGEEHVKGFGLTLALGVACDIVTMFCFKAPALRLLAQHQIERHPKFWGIEEDLEEAERARSERGVKGDVAHA